jgi:hypothetical protein
MALVNRHSSLKVVRRFRVNVDMPCPRVLFIDLIHDYIYTCPISLDRHRLQIHSQSVNVETPAAALGEMRHVETA